MVTWKAGHRPPTTSTSSSCSLDLSALSRQLSLTCAVVLPAVTHSSLEEYHLHAKDLPIHIPGLNLFFELQTHILIYKQLPQCLHSMSGIRKLLRPKHLLWAKLTPPQACLLPSNHNTRCSARHPAHLQLPPSPPLAPFLPSYPSVSPVDFTLVSQSIFPSSTAIPIISPGLTNQPPQRTCSLFLTSINLVIL